MPKRIAKSYAISDAKISFVSLVDKAANKHEFLITKSDDGCATFQTNGRIVKTDNEQHFVTGIVYEPMAEDTDGNYMTEAEIEKAAHWFMKNSGDADIQHCFEKAENVEVVESYVAKCDMEIEGQTIKKGTWLMTMEITDDEVWGKVEKGEITGFSMGGKGVYSEVDEDISDPDNPVAKAGGKRGIMKALASMFGMDVVEKGKVKQNYQKRSVRDNFWNAYYALSEVLMEHYNPDTGNYEVVHDEATIREALEDFNDIVVGLLASEDGLAKSIEKAGKKMSNQNKETLKGIYENLGAFVSMFEE
ncbi:MAG: XkdF-like putative serine protease domain-containing protein, partial [Eubacteriales bacterium]|nr:XkdF-like putative serine protease domain-containing protein [Eubacteriales bacterium]